MRIALFSDHFYPEIGGIQDSVACLGRELNKRGHQLNFFVAQWSEKDFAKAKLPVKEIYLGNNVKITRFFSLPVKSPTQQSRLVIPNFLRWLAVKKFKPDIIHSHTFFGLGLEAAAAARILKVPLVGTNHWVITEFNGYSPVAAKAFARLSLKAVIWYYNHCDFVTAPSRTVLDEMAANGFVKPHQVVSNQIDLEIFKPDANLDIKKIKAEFGVSPATVACAGRLGQEKNIDVVIRAVALVKQRLPNVRLAIAGHGSAESGLRKLANELRLEENVKFLGTLTQAGLARLYRASEIFTIASTSESQSMVLLQAMACGLPVIGANWRALPEYINKQNGFLFKPYDHRELAEKIVYLLEHAEARKSLGRGGLEFVQSFSASEIGKKWEEIYERVIEDKDVGRLGDVRRPAKNN
ncbi:MAG: glycosyltransferase [bacterium]|nr:glycosyltransferase [bacterium]